jgi:hypothetical protein
MRKTIAILALILASLAQPAKADIIYDNLKSTTYNPLSGVFVNGSQSHSESFVAGTTDNLGDILVPMAFLGGSGNSPLWNLSLKDSSNNTLESWTGLTAPDVNGSPISVVDAASVLHPLLTSGDTYTLLATGNAANTDDGWDIGNSLHLRTAGFRVESQVATPEPGSMTLLCTGIAAFGGFQLRRWRRRPSAT